MCLLFFEVLQFYDVFFHICVINGAKDEPEGCEVGLVSQILQNQILDCI